MQSFVETNDIPEFVKNYLKQNIVYADDFINSIEVSAIFTGEIVVEEETPPEEGPIVEEEPEPEEVEAETPPAETPPAETPPAENVSISHSGGGGGGSGGSSGIFPIPPEIKEQSKTEVVVIQEIKPEVIPPVKKKILRLHK